MIDGCVLRESNAFLQQAARLTRAVYMEIPRPPALLQYLLVRFRGEGLGRWSHTDTDRSLPCCSRCSWQMAKQGPASRCPRRRKWTCAPRASATKPLSIQPLSAPSAFQVSVLGRAFSTIFASTPPPLLPPTSLLSVQGAVRHVQDALQAANRNNQHQPKLGRQCCGEQNSYSSSSSNARPAITSLLPTSITKYLQYKV